MRIWVVSYDELETLWDIAKRCARATGRAKGATLGLIGLSTVVVDGPGLDPWAQHLHWLGLYMEPCHVVGKYIHASVSERFS